MNGETHTHATQAPPPAGQPCKCDQQFGDAVPLLLIVFALLMGVDRLRSYLRSRKEKQKDDAERRQS
jgi:hypothetical protein